MNITLQPLCFLFIFLASGNLFASQAAQEPRNPPVCEFEFGTDTPCVYNDITVKLHKFQVAADKTFLTKLEVLRKGKTYKLEITQDTALQQGNTGYISFEDINFDGIADLAITTSFGLANLYLDYWIYDPKNNKYSRVGNYSKFTLDPDKKTLSNTVKFNAEKYEQNNYYWKDNKLVKQK